MMKLSVIIPVFNETRTIEQVIHQVAVLPFEKEILVVDDGSTDGTADKLDALRNGNVRVFHHPKNLGKGAAIRTALSEAKGDIILFQDADLEYDPSDYPVLLEPIEKGIADVVYGTRLTGGRPQRVHFFWHKVGNNVLTLVTNILYNSTLTDMETGYKVFRREVLESFPLRSNDFRIEPEVTAKVLKRKYRLYEVPIAYYGRSYAEGKKITWKDGIKALWALLKYRFVD
jgi:glycosyltransferase involved in cell wall biosynthesis